MTTIHTSHTITHAEYVAILRAGIDAARLREDGTFAAACYGSNTVAELLASLRESRADATDCAAWGITPTQWRASVRAALAGRAHDYERQHNLCD
jgi:hypothetical protein